MKIKLIMVCVASILCANAVSASSNIIGATVLYTGTTYDGSFFVHLNKTIDEPGCPSDTILIPSGHPQIKNWLALATTAFATGLPVTVTASGCAKGMPTITGGGHFHIGPR
jgi:hypothetical protein